MSASPIARQATNCQFIPSRRVVLNDASQLPAEYSSTPGGTLYSTTPGGTRIVYERNFLLNLRNSPVARTPPKNLHNFPDVLRDSPSKPASGVTVIQSQSPCKEPTIDEGPEQFDMDI